VRHRGSVNPTFAFHQFNHPFHFHIAESARKQSAVSGLLSNGHASMFISKDWFFVGDFEDFVDMAARFDRLPIGLSESSHVHLTESRASAVRGYLSFLKRGIRRGGTATQEALDSRKGTS
jgi:hypothetical protein